MTVATWILTTEYGLDRHAWDNKIDWAVPAALVCYWTMPMTMVRNADRTSDWLDSSSPLRSSDRLHQTLDPPVPPPHDKRDARPPMGLDTPSRFHLHVLLWRWRPPRLHLSMPAHGRDLECFQPYLQKGIYLHRNDKSRRLGRRSQRHQRSHRSRCTLPTTQPLQPRHLLPPKDRLELDIRTRISRHWSGSRSDILSLENPNNNGLNLGRTHFLRMVDSRMSIGYHVRLRTLSPSFLPKIRPRYLKEVFWERSFALCYWDRRVLS